MNLKPGDKLIGDGEISLKKEWYIWIVKKIIQGWQLAKRQRNWRHTHVKIVLYRLRSGAWLVFEFVPPRAKWSRMTEIPKGYKVYRDPGINEYNRHDLYEQARKFNGTIYDVGDLYEFLIGKKVIKGLNNQWFVCSTGVNEIMKACGFDLWPGDTVISPGKMADDLNEVQQE